MFLVVSSNFSGSCDDTHTHSTHECAARVPPEWIQEKMPTKNDGMRECSRFVWDDKEFLVFIALTFYVYTKHYACTAQTRRSGAVRVIRVRKRERNGDGEKDNEKIKSELVWSRADFNLICDGHGLCTPANKLTRHRLSGAIGYIGNDRLSASMECR